MTLEPVYVRADDERVRFRRAALLLLGPALALTVFLGWALIVGTAPPSWMLLFMPMLLFSWVLLLAVSYRPSTIMRNGVLMRRRSWVPFSRFTLVEYGTVRLAETFRTDGCTFVTFHTEGGVTYDTWFVDPAEEALADLRGFLGADRVRARAFKE